MTVLSLTNPVNGTTGDANLIGSNNSAILAVINGNLDSGNLKSNAGILGSQLNGYPSDSTKFLRGDGSWAVPPSPTTTITPVTTLPGSPTDKQTTIYTDSTSAPTYYWMMQYNSTATRWLFIGGSFLEGTTTVTVPTAGDYYVEIGAAGQTQGNGVTCRLLLTAGGITLDARQGNTGGGTENIETSAYDKGKMTGLTTSQVLTPTVTGSPVRQYIRIQPARLS